MFRVPSDIKAGKAVTINGQSYAKDARIEVDDVRAIAGRLRAYFSKGLLYLSPDPHGRRRAGHRQPVSLPPVVLKALLAQEQVQDAPAAPTAASAAFKTATSVDVSFTAGAAGAKTITNYMYKVGNGAWTELSPVDTSSPIVVPVAANASGSLKIRALSAIGPGAESAAIAYSTKVPSAPTALVATPAGTSVSIAFTAGAGGGAAISDYEFSRDNGVTWLSAGTAVSPITITGLSIDTQYSVKVRAVSAAGNGAASAAVTFTTLDVPGAPTALVATPSASEVSIAFTAGGDGGSAITNYEYTFNDGVVWTAFSPVDTSSPVVIGPIPAETEYTVKLRAVNAVGNGVASDAVTFTTLAAE